MHRLCDESGMSDMKTKKFYDSPQEALTVARIVGKGVSWIEKVVEFRGNLIKKRVYVLVDRK